MKVFIHYKPRNKADAFEGTRLRKTIKGACEAVGLYWVDAPQDGVSIAHFIAPSDLPLLREQKEKGIPCVVSAFYAEDDPNAALLSSHYPLKLSKRALSFLNEADLVLVPDARLATFAKIAGVKTRIEVLEPAVRMNRFTRGGVERDVFPRYFGIKPNVKTVVATGSYHDKNTLKLLKKVAEACPKLEFYFFGACKSYDVLHLAKQKARLIRSANLHLKDIVQDDIYRSALMYSTAYISNDANRPDPIAPIEAFASKTQVVSFSSDRPNPLLLEGRTCRYFPSPEAMAEYLTALYEGTAESTIESAYAISKGYSLLASGKKLNAYYESLIKE